MAGSGVPFEAAGGDGPVVDGARRAGEVRTAHEGLLQIRRVVNGREGEGVPAPWEVRSVARAVALALEAAGIPPSAVDGEGRRVRTGYRVAEGPQGRAQVSWVGPPGSGAAGEEGDRLAECSAVLERLGWVCLLYRGPRGRRFVEVEAPR
ncbi:hypothetical protein V3664_12480 [Streptomyces sp. CS62]